MKQNLSTFLILTIAMFIGFNCIKPTPTPGPRPPAKSDSEKCEPKWYKNQEKSTKEVVYGYSWEKSRNSSLAAKKGIAQAQSMALSQINQNIDDDVRLAIEEISAKAGKEIIQICRHLDCYLCIIYGISVLYWRKNIHDS